MNQPTTYTVHTTSTSGSFGWGRDQGNTEYPAAGIYVTAADGKMVASYRRTSCYGGGKFVDAYYTLADGTRHTLPDMGSGEYRVGDTRPAPGTYRNQRVAFCAVIKALYNVEAK